MLPVMSVVAEAVVLSMHVIWKLSSVKRSKPVLIVHFSGEMLWILSSTG